MEIALNSFYFSAPQYKLLSVAVMIDKNLANIQLD